VTQRHMDQRGDPGFGSEEFSGLTAMISEVL
jgi:hypothetical protein